MLKLILIFITLTSCYCCGSTINNVQHLSLFNEKWTNEKVHDNEMKRLEKNEWYEDFLRNDTIVGRTFGGIRRLKMAIPAIMYKLGVFTTMLGFLTLLTIKGVIIGLIILVIQLSAGLSKLHSSHKEHGWEPEPWKNKIPQNVHVHVHGGGHHQGHYSYPPGHSSSIWDRDRIDNPQTFNSNPNLNLYASLTPYSAYNNYNNYKNSQLNNKINDDLLIKLREYKELKELRELRDSLYQQVV